MSLGRWHLGARVRENAHGVAIKEEADTSNQHDDPLEALPIDRLVDLAPANVAVLMIQCGSVL
jgi:hypothetical protein